MKVGILTFHRAHNYGAVLQCYALQTYLERRGYDVFVIDYNNPNLWRIYNWFLWERFPRLRIRFYLLVKQYYRQILLLPKRKLLYDKFQNFIKHSIRLADIDSVERNPYDVIVIGSDQVWDFQHANGLDNYYWGKFSRPQNTMLVSYAASLETYWPENYEKDVMSCLERFDLLGVREGDLCEKIESLSVNLPVYTLPDPTFLLSAEDWEKILVKPNVVEPYLFVYQARDNNGVIKYAQKIAECKKLKLIVLSATVDRINSKECICSSPEEFLGWIKYSNFVISTSFHGIVFSLLFKKKFCAVNLNDGKDSRVKNLLREFGMMDNLVELYDNCDIVHSEYELDLCKQTQKADDFFSLVESIHSCKYAK